MLQPFAELRCVMVTVYVLQLLVSARHIRLHQVSAVYKLFFLDDQRVANYFHSPALQIAPKTVVTRRL